MKAVLFEKHGGPEVLHLAEVPDPTAGPGEVVVDIHAASVNAADYKVRLGGGAYSGGGVKLPHILGRDFSGVVSAVGPGVTDLAVGDPVFGVCDQGIEGAYAEKIAIKAAIIAKKAGAPRPCRGGGDGLDQPHRAVGARGHGQAQSRRNHPDPGRRRRRRRLRDPARQASRRDGDHDGQRPQPRLCAPARRRPGRSTTTRRISPRPSSGCDVVFDTVGGEVQVRSYAVLKPGGRLVWIAPAPAGFQPTRKDVQVLRPGVARDRAHLERMLALLEAGAVSPPAITRYKLADAAEAHRVSEGRHLQGKLVFDVR